LTQTSAVFASVPPTSSAAQTFSPSSNGVSPAQDCQAPAGSQLDTSEIHRLQTKRRKSRSANRRCCSFRPASVSHGAGFALRISRTVNGASGGTSHNSARKSGPSQSTSAPCRFTDRNPSARVRNRPRLVSGPLPAVEITSSLLVGDLCNALASAG
jgi:hypothetical protein